jgi:hypothetical protein
MRVIDSPPLRPRLRNGWIYMLIVLWGTAVSAGTIGLWRYQLTPGVTPAPAQAVWPADAAVPTHPGRPTLVMIAHPQCSCTRASLNELRRLIVRFGELKERPVVYLSVIVPEGVGPRWTEGPVLSNAASIRDLNVVLDPGGRFAQRFGATTSGHVLLYAADGSLLFSGGITAARAHEGDAAGQEAIVAALYGRTAVAQSTPVFGCALQSGAALTRRIP